MQTWLAIVLVVAGASPPDADATSVASGPAFAAARQPQVAVSPFGRVHVAFGVDNAIYCATSSDNARSFEPPVKVGQHGVMALGKRRGPRIAATRDSLVVVAVCGQ